MKMTFQYCHSREVTTKLMENEVMQKWRSSFDKQNQKEKSFPQNFFSLLFDLRIRLTTCCWPLHVVGLRHHDLGDLQPCGRGLFRQWSWNIASRRQRRGHVAVERRKLDPWCRLRRWSPSQRSRWSGIRPSNRWLLFKLLLQMLLP